MQDYTLYTTGYITYMCIHCVTAMVVIVLFISTNVCCIFAVFTAGWNIQCTRFDEPDGKCLMGFKFYVTLVYWCSKPGRFKLFCYFQTFSTHYFQTKTPSLMHFITKKLC